MRRSIPAGDVPPVVTFWQRHQGVVLQAELLNGACPAYCSRQLPQSLARQVEGLHCVGTVSNALTRSSGQRATHSPRHRTPSPLPAPRIGGGVQWKPFSGRARQSAAPGGPAVGPPLPLYCCVHPHSPGSSALESPAWISHHATWLRCTPPLAARAAATRHDVRGARSRCACRGRGHATCRRRGAASARVPTMVPTCSHGHSTLLPWSSTLVTCPYDHRHGEGARGREKGQGRITVRPHGRPTAGMAELLDARRFFLQFVEDSMAGQVSSMEQLQVVHMLRDPSMRRLVANTILDGLASRVRGPRRGERRATGIFSRGLRALGRGAGSVARGRAAAARRDPRRIAGGKQLPGPGFLHHVLPCGCLRCATREIGGREHPALGTDAAGSPPPCGNCLRGLASRRLVPVPHRRIAASA